MHSHMTDTWGTHTRILYVDSRVHTHPYVDTKAHTRTSMHRHTGRTHLYKCTQVCLCKNIQDMQRNLLEVPAPDTNSYVQCTTQAHRKVYIYSYSSCPELRRYRVKGTEKKGEACTPRLDIQSAATFRLTPPVSR